LRLRGASVLFVLCAVSATASPVSAAPASSGGGAAVHDLELTVHPGIGGRFGGRVDVEIRYRVVNAGAVPVKPTTRLRVSSQIGGGIARGPTPGPDLPPGASFVVHERVAGVLPFGSVTVAVTVRAGGRTTRATASAAVVPWLGLLTLTVVALAAWAMWRRRIRHRTRKEARARGV
jgi:hypothetical protein